MANKRPIIDVDAESDKKKKGKSIADPNQPSILSFYGNGVIYHTTSAQQKEKLAHDNWIEDIRQKSSSLVASSGSNIDSYKPTHNSTSSSSSSSATNNSNNHSRYQSKLNTHTLFNIKNSSEWISNNHSYSNTTNTTHTTKVYSNNTHKKSYKEYEIDDDIDREDKEKQEEEIRKKYFNSSSINEHVGDIGALDVGFDRSDNNSSMHNDILNQSKTPVFNVRAYMSNALKPTTTTTTTTDSNINNQNSYNTTGTAYTHQSILDQHYKSSYTADIKPIGELFNDISIDSLYTSVLSAPLTEYLPNSDLKTDGRRSKKEASAEVLSTPKTRFLDENQYILYYEHLLMLEIKAAITAFFDSSRFPYIPSDSSHVPTTKSNTNYNNNSSNNGRSGSGTGSSGDRRPDSSNRRTSSSSHDTNSASPSFQRLYCTAQMEHINTDADNYDNNESKPLSSSSSNNGSSSGWYLCDLEFAGAMTFFDDEGAAGGVSGDAYKQHTTGASSGSSGGNGSSSGGDDKGGSGGKHGTSSNVKGSSKQASYTTSSGGVNLQKEYLVLLVRDHTATIALSSSSSTTSASSSSSSSHSSDKPRRVDGNKLDSWSTCGNIHHTLGIVTSVTTLGRSIEADKCNIIVCLPLTYKTPNNTHTIKKKLPFTIGKQYSILPLFNLSTSIREWSALHSIRDHRLVPLTPYLLKAAPVVSANRLE